MSELTPLAIPDRDVAKYIIGRTLRDATRDRLRAKGEWPQHFFVGGRAFVLVKDIEDFLEKRRANRDADIARMKQRSNRANEAKYGHEIPSAL